MKSIRPRSGLHGAVRVPGSKSITHRGLIASALAHGESRLESPLLCRDVLSTLHGLSRLGASIHQEETHFDVTGTGGRFPRGGGPGEIDLGDSGTSYRLLLPVAALGGRDWLLTGSPRMQERPVGELVRSLGALGAPVSFPGREGYPPVQVKGGGIPGGRVSIRGDTSSQFVSALLLCGPFTEKGLEISVAGPLVSRPYVDVTIEVMGRFGVTVEREGYDRFRVPAGGGYRGTHLEIEGDFSSASYFWAAAAVTGGSVVTENVHPFTTRQGDAAFLHVLEDMGCHVERRAASVRVEGRALRAPDVDMKDMPDMVPTLAVMALFAEGTTRIRNAAHLRHKESDRLQAVAHEFRRLGAKVEVLADGLAIPGGQSLVGARVDPHNDHRIAMSLAVVGLKVPGVSIVNEGCVEKSFPGFWDLWENM